MCPFRAHKTTLDDLGVHNGFILISQYILSGNQYPEVVCKNDPYWQSYGLRGVAIWECVCNG
jgi:hypothetical protein